MSDRLHVFYDGSCGLCSRSVAWALARDRDGRLEPIPVPSPEAERMLGAAAYPRALDELHVWSERGGLHTGADAIAAMLSRLPGWRVAGALLRFPPVRLVARPAYRFVARRRGLFGPPACELPRRR